MPWPSSRLDLASTMPTLLAWHAPSSPAALPNRVRTLLTLHTFAWLTIGFGRLSHWNLYFQGIRCRIVSGDAVGFASTFQKYCGASAQKRREQFGYFILAFLTVRVDLHEVVALEIVEDFDFH
jgi:hypothetical protein